MVTTSPLRLFRQIRGDKVSDGNMHSLLILKSLKVYIHELALKMLIQYVYGWEQMLCWSIHVKRPQLFYKRT
ncbi:hypothetical protein NL676_019662 [Syzygium grande]|nr:hypothetical protein NL676_019662 [Syzygium grande]